MNKCEFDIWYVGKCGKDTVENSEFCQNHSSAKCVVCGGQAKYEEGIGSCGSFPITVNFCSKSCEDQYSKEN